MPNAETECRESRAINQAAFSPERSRRGGTHDAPSMHDDELQGGGAQLILAEREQIGLLGLAQTVNGVEFVAFGLG